MAKKPGLPLERHREIAKELIDIHQRLLGLLMEIDSTHAKASTVRAVALNAYESIGDLRSELDNLVCLMPDGGPEIYFPPKRT